MLNMLGMLGMHSRGLNMKLVYIISLYSSLHGMASGSSTLCPVYQWYERLFYLTFSSLRPKIGQKPARLERGTAAWHHWNFYTAHTVLEITALPLSLIHI